MCRLITPFLNTRYPQYTVIVQVAEPLLPYALAFAAGAMVYVVVDDLIPEANQWLVGYLCFCDSNNVSPLSAHSGNGRLSSTGVIIGFIAMMSLDVGLG